MRVLRHWAWSWVMALSLACWAPLAWGQDAPELIRGHMGELALKQMVRVADVSVSGSQVLPIFYERRNYVPAWTDPAVVDDYLRVVRDMGAEGLNPADYHLAAVERQRQAPPSATASANLDVLLTDGLLRLTTHLARGKLNAESLDPEWDLRNDHQGDMAEALQAMIDSSLPGKALENVRPATPLYLRLKKALVDYRDYAARGGWRLVPEGGKLEKGMAGDRVAAVRARLEATGELAPGGKKSAVFDDALEKAVRRFQRSHGIDVDGKVGKLTLEALNLSAADRVAQVQANLERVRWGLPAADGRRILINIPTFTAEYRDKDQLLWSAKIQVGTPERKTPTLTSEMTHIIFNPTWTVPPTIIKEDILPEARQNPDAITRRNLLILDGSGRRVDPTSIPWGAYSGGNFPYTLRQDPGVGNALGRVKFMFPNAHSIYLHDTPHKNHFGHAVRTYSSGCIRIERPLLLAETLLADPVKWSPDRIQEVLGTNKTRTVWLNEPVALSIHYLTAGLDEAGGLILYKDVYGRDRDVTKGLEMAYRYKAPKVAKVTPAVPPTADAGPLPPMLSAPAPLPIDAGRGIP